MDKYKNIKRARHHLVFLLALIVGSVLIYFLNNLDMKKQGLGMLTLENPIAPDLNITTASLNKIEKDMAKVAWRYFENNYNVTTGLVNSVDNYPSTTLWDTGNYMMALISSKHLKIIDISTYNTRMEALLNTLSKIELYKGLLPNKVYNTQTLTMTNYENKVSKKGIGWSAIDIGRILIPLAYLEFNQPIFSKQIKNILSRWNLKNMTKQGALYGAVVAKGKESILQEGRLGYEQYTSKMFAFFGVDITNALRYDKYLDFINIEGIDIPYDRRDKEHSDANNYVLMEPYMLDGLEFGWDYFSKEFSYRLYKAQEERYNNTGIFTAVSEDHLDQKPYFIYNTLYVNKKVWAAIDEFGKVHNNMKQLSTKASFAMDALYHTTYTNKLIEQLKPLQSKRGWYTGIYEKSGKINKSITCNTNAIILESLMYKEIGPILNMIKNK
ncbi:MAG: DUF3131 domain-containing protein [Campylobacterota bacterium]|nr:DUF3131 domain-containing protein [Campylobacterota bacterium]